MEIRLATADDAEAIERIRVRGWQTAYRNVFPPEQLDAMPVDWSRFVENLRAPEPGWACFVCETDGCVLGWAVVGPSGSPDEGELHGLYVDPENWSRGAGRSLIRRAEIELAFTWAEAVLWVLIDNLRARRFYELAGWRCDGTTSTFDRFGVSAPIIRYRKRLSNSTSRS